MGGTAREMDGKTREIGGTPRITIFHDLFIGLSMFESFAYGSDHATARQGSPSALKQYLLLLPLHICL